MDDLYKLIEGKCKERGIKISKLCTDVGIRQSILSDLKHGRTKTLSVPTASKLAEYFGVDITEFLDYANEDSAESYYEGWKDACESSWVPPEFRDGIAQKEKPAPTNGDELAEEDQRIIELLHQLTPENRERIVEIVKALASQ